MLSQTIFNMKNIAKTINSLSSPDPISHVYKNETVAEQQSA